MRTFILGVIIFVGFAATVLSLRPGGLRRQLRFAARRFRIFLIVGGAFIFVSGAIRLLFPSGPVADYGPIVLAVVLGVVFLVLIQDPKDQ